MVNNNAPADSALPANGFIGLKNGSEGFYVPKIDIAPWLSNPNSAAAQRIVDDVRTACISTGFFQIVGHGISKDLQERVFRAASEFFALPFDEKVKLDAKKTVGHRGYDVLASQSYEEGVLPDLKEGYYVGAEVSTTHPQSGRFFMGPNAWPSASLISSTVFETPLMEYYSAMQTLSLKMLSLIGTTLEKGEVPGYGGVHIPRPFHALGHLSDTPACPLRLVRYPAAKAAALASSLEDVLDKPQYGASAHTDFGALTLLLQDGNPGLEVLDESVAAGKGVWRPIDPDTDAYVVNVGDMISVMTAGVYKSSVHRVVCKRPQMDRYSVVFFLDGCLDAKLNRVEGSKVIEEHQKDLQAAENSPMLTVEQHMTERMTMSYGKGKKDMRRDGVTVAV